jgi:hypothetical protein
MERKMTLEIPAFLKREPETEAEAETRRAKYRAPEMSNGVTVVTPGTK